MTQAVTDLQHLIGKTFVKERFGTRTEAVLAEVKRNRVVLAFPGRQDRQTLPISEFTKFFRLAS